MTAREKAVEAAVCEVCREAPPMSNDHSNGTLCFECFTGWYEGHITDRATIASESRRRRAMLAAAPEE
jgi:hypothetical protein